MDKTTILKLVVFLVFLVVQHRTNCQWVPRPIAPRPLCANQFALASHACAFLPYVPSPPPSPPSPPSLAELQVSHKQEHQHNHEHEHQHNHEHEHQHNHEHEHEHEHRHKHEHEHEHRQKHEHQHEHEHRRTHRRHRHAVTPLEENCCRWLETVDSECVCDLLVYLPPFLSRPVHQYTVFVKDSCNVTFQCGSRITT